MDEITELDKAELKVEMRNLYKQVGLYASIRCLYEILLSANILLDVILEESDNAKSNDKL